MGMKARMGEQPRSQMVRSEVHNSNNLGGDFLACSLLGNKSSKLGSNLNRFTGSFLAISGASRRMPKLQEKGAKMGKEQTRA